MSNRAYDAIIIGGGPGGSTAATYLAKAGKRVLVLEKERFPRFHVGESLLPYTWEFFEEMGVISKLEAENFPRKLGAQFHIGNKSKSLFFVFAQGRYTKYTETFQVERARFDDILLTHAQECGADVRQQWAVQNFELATGGVRVQARGPAGALETFDGSYLIDASGRSNLTGNQQQLRVVHPNLKKVAVFGHFENVSLDDGTKRGDTIIVRLKDKWFWIIPVSSSKTSVGCVLDQRELARTKESPEELFAQLCEGTPAVRERMTAAKRVGEIHTTSDFSYYNKRFTGERLLRVGDAAGFMDPIFSAGVYLAMYSGRLAARTVVQAFEGKAKSAFAQYEKRVKHALEFYWELVEQYYTTPFLEVFFNPREKYQLLSAVNAALAGELEGGWKIRWRMRLFFLIVKMQARRPFIPRLHLD